MHHYDDTLSPDQNLKLAGCDANGFLIEPKDTDTTIRDLERFLGGKQTTLALDDDERETLTDAIDEGDLAQIVKSEASRAATLRSKGQHERADEAERHARHFTDLQALTKPNKARETLRVRDLASNREFTDAVLRWDLHAVNRMLVDTLRDADAPYALRVACIGAMIQIAPFVDTDDGGKFNDAWLSRTTGIPRSTCKELIDAHRDVGTDLAVLLLGTEHGEERKDVQAFARKEGESLRSAIEALKEYHTAHMIAHAGECEEVARCRKISLSEADVLDAVGLGCRAGRERFVKMPIKAAQLWLARMLDETNEAAERTGGVVATAKGVCVKPLNPAVATRRLLTQRQLNADNVREL